GRGPFPGALSVARTVLWPFPASLVAWAFLVRGGLSYSLMGIRILRRSGRKAWRLQCAWRALLVWAPVTALLVLSVQVNDTERFRLASAAWWLALAALAGYLVSAMRYPARGPHDVLAGTYLEPR